MDWTDHRRAPVVDFARELGDTAPGPAPTAGSEPEAATREQDRDPPWMRGAGGTATRATAARTRDDTAEIMAEVRRVTRDEVDRAVNLVTQRASDATRRIEPMITQYGDQVMRWLRNLGIIAIALVVLWMLLQTFAQTSLLEWIGDRIDNVTGDAAQEVELRTWLGSNP